MLEGEGGMATRAPLNGVHRMDPWPLSPTPSQPRPRFQQKKYLSCSNKKHGDMSATDGTPAQRIRSFYAMTTFSDHVIDVVNFGATNTGPEP